MLKTLRKTFSYTAYTWGNAKTNGHSTNTEIKKGSPIRPIEVLRGKIQKIGFSAKHGAAITTDGKLYTWGDKNYGRLGLAGHPTDIVTIPTEVAFFSKNNIKVKDFALARNHTIVLDTNGLLYSFGKGAFSSNFLANLLFSEFVALGHPKAEHITKPKLIEKLVDDPVSQISTGNHFSAALTQKGKLMVWGRGEFGVLGCGNKQVAEPMENEIVAKLCEDLKVSILKIKSCHDFTSLLTSDGTLYSFGNNDEGVMGIGRNMGVDFCEVVNMPTPMEFIDGDQKIVDFSLGEISSAVLTKSGKLYQSGQKLYFNPELLRLDYDKVKVKTFAAFAKGVGLVSKDNELFLKGNFWPNETDLDEDVNTGISKVNVGDIFEGKEIVQIGNKFGETAFVLVKE